MFHEPAAGIEDDPASAYKTRLGVRMVLIYSAVYAGFVLITVLFPPWMGAIVILGLNLAMVYGFSLIVFALILAVIYNGLCSARETAMTRAGAVDPGALELEGAGK